MNEARGYLDVLRIRGFLYLWLAQIASLLALNSSLFVTIILVSKATGSDTQTAGVIAAFNIPAIFLSAFGGIVVDRVSKKVMLVTTNALRIGFQLVLTLVAFLGLSKQIDPAFFILLVYVAIFVSSAVGQFFAPAEGAMIPLLVGREGLLAANSLFTLTVVGTQVAAIMLLVPFAIKLIGVINSLLLLGILYMVATFFASRLQRDQAPERQVLSAGSAWRQAWKEAGEGWDYALKRPVIMLAIFQIALVAALVYVVGTIAPSYTSSVLGLGPEDAIFIFAPAGVGILGASAFVVRYGPRFHRYLFPIIGTILMGLSFLALGLIGSLSGGPQAPLFRLYPNLTLTATSAVSLASVFAGVALAFILIPAQTAVQEEAPDEIRGRVLTVQFTLSNALGIIPLLIIATLTDIYGTPYVVMGVGVALLVVALVNYLYARQLTRHRRRKPVLQALPIPGTDVTTVRADTSNGNDAAVDEQTLPQ
ncbi:MAG: MFS transporter [Anaerolineae bacterium]